MSVGNYYFKRNVLAGSFFILAFFKAPLKKLSFNCIVFIQVINALFTIMWRGFKQSTVITEEIIKERGQVSLLDVRY